jgi:hypothetical protein
MQQETMALSPSLHIEKYFQPKWLLNNELTKTTCVGLIWLTIDLEKRLSLAFLKRCFVDFLNYIKGSKLFSTYKRVMQNFQ